MVSGVTIRRAWLVTFGVLVLHGALACGGEAKATSESSIEGIRVEIDQLSGKPRAEAIVQHAIACLNMSPGCTPDQDFARGLVSLDPGSVDLFLELLAADRVALREIPFQYMYTTGSKGWLEYSPIREAVFDLAMDSSEPIGLRIRALVLFHRSGEFGSVRNIAKQIAESRSDKAARDAAWLLFHIPGENNKPISLESLKRLDPDIDSPIGLEAVLARAQHLDDQILDEFVEILVSEAIDKRARTTAIKQAGFYDSNIVTDALISLLPPSKWFEPEPHTCKDAVSLVLVVRSLHLIMQSADSNAEIHDALFSVREHLHRTEACVQEYLEDDLPMQPWSLGVQLSGGICCEVHGQRKA